MKQSFALTLFLSLLGASGEAKDPAGAWKYDLTRVSNAHLSFTEEQWKAIKPVEAARPGGGGPPFSLEGFLAGAWQRNLDLDQDGQVSREEFTKGFAHWSEQWDTKHVGSLDADAVREGLGSLLRPPSPGGASPGGPPGGQGLRAANGMRNGISGMQGIDFKYVHADLELDDHKFGDVAVRYKGNGTYMDARQSEKKSFKVDLNEFVKGQKLGDRTRLNFHNNLADPSWMNEAMAYELYRAAGVPAPQTAYTRLAVTVPGTFDHQALGLYSVVENPDNHWAEANFGSKKGLILKPSTRELFVDKGEEWDAYAQAYDAKADITAKQARRVKDFAKLITSGSDEDLAAHVGDFLEIDEFARFMAVTVWLSTTDSILMLGQNYLIYLHPKTNKFSFMPWDADRTFGNFFFPNPEALSVRSAWGEDNRFLSRVMKVPAVQEAYLARLQEFQETIFDPAQLQRHVDELAALIRPVVAEEGPQKLERFERAVANPAATAAVAPAPEAPGGFSMPAAQPIKQFIVARHQSVAAQLAGQAEGKPLSGGGGPGGRPPGGGPGRFLGPVLLKAADRDEDTQVSPAEFRALAERWFAAWDANGDGQLETKELSEGLKTAFPMPAPPGPPGPPPQ